jgi:acyl-homoserine lactone acylase PvdQ
MNQRSRLCLPFLILTVATACAADPLAEHVTTYRDNYGVPHIVGDTEEATFFGYGYAQAEDHLEGMMLQYRDAQGRRAEIQGFSALGDGYLHFIPYLGATGTPNRLWNRTPLEAGM